MCRITNDLLAEKRPDGTLYFVVRRPPDSEFVRTSAPERAEWDVTWLPDSGEDVIIPTPTDHGYITTHEADTPFLEVLWNVLAVGGGAAEAEDAVLNKVPEIVG